MAAYSLEQSFTSEIGEISLKFCVSVRNFKGNSSDKKLGNWRASFSSINEFKNLLWNMVQCHVGREVIFPEGKPEFHEKEAPSIEDLNRFIGIATKNSGKHVYKLDSLSLNTLKCWEDENRELHLYIYKHSSAVSSSKLYKMVEVLLKNAENIESGVDVAVQEILQELKNVHLFHYEGLEQAWQLWADYICKQKAENHDRLIREAPPPELRKCFNSAKDCSEERLDSINQDVHVASSINNQISSRFVDIKLLLNRSLHRFDRFGANLNALNEDVKAFQNKFD